MVGLTVLLGTSILAWFGLSRDDWFEKRVKVVEPGRLVRGAWQKPGPLRRVIAREGIKTIVTLTAINSSDPKFEGQQKVVEETGIGWVIVPMRGSRATAEQMAAAADLLADQAPAAGVFPLRGGASPDQPGARGVPDPPPRIHGGAGLAGGLDAALVSTRLGGRPQRSVPDRGVRAGRALAPALAGTRSLGDRAWRVVGTDGSGGSPG